MAERRTWNTPIREPWNPVVAQLLKAVDEHVRQHMATGDTWHAIKAAELRAYTRELKDWIHRRERLESQQTGTNEVES
ncbi:MAG: hypothetical protein ACO3ST_02540, partial [Burkholderiaceae bacterium]